MAQTPQPGFLAALIKAFTTFDEAHGFAVNLFAVVALAMIGGAFLAGRRLARPALIAFTVLCLADWVLIEDFGFFGGLGTDPNSMIPMILLATGGYLAVSRIPPTAAEATADIARRAPAGWREALRPANLRSGLATADFRSIVAVGAVGLVVLGAAPMTVAQANPNADPILAQAITGATAPLRMAAPRFGLTDQSGQTVTLANLRGKVVLLGFFDPVCTSDCRSSPRSSARPPRCCPWTPGASTSRHQLQPLTTEVSASRGLRPPRRAWPARRLAVPDRHASRARAGTAALRASFQRKISRPGSMGRPRG